MGLGDRCGAYRRVNAAPGVATDNCWVAKILLERPIISKQKTGTGNSGKGENMLVVRFTDILCAKLYGHGFDLVVVDP